MTDFIFLGSKITSKDDSAMKLADAPWKESYNKHRLHIKKQKHHFAKYSQSYDFSSSHVQMWELNHKEN